MKGYNTTTRGHHPLTVIVMRRRLPVAISLYIPPGKFSFFSFSLSAEGSFLLSSCLKFSEASKYLNTVDP
ncbi:MAG: hypothetical protein WBI47_06005 [Atribacterales bacterium]